MFAGLIISKDIPSLGLQRSFAYLLLVQEFIIIGMINYLEKKKPENQDKKKKAKKRKEIYFLIDSDISKQTSVPQKMLKLLIEILTLGISEHRNTKNKYAVR
jgi:hypothetical protein